jgi:peptidoglycan/LPS O-acetylase OafA/YrhL
MEYHKNNIGLIRLILALSVIVGHSPEMTDGNRGREPLTMVFGTLSLGEVAVYGFFIISGYLITGSYFSAPSLISYLMRRVFRIYPAFVVAFLLSVFVMVPVVGGHVSGLSNVFERLLLLAPPPLFPGILAGLPVPALNGAMWTIAYEFRCYLLVAILGLWGWLGKPRLMLFLTVMAIVASLATTFPAVQDRLEALDARFHTRAFIGQPARTIQLTAVFLIGSCIYNYRNVVIAPARGRFALLCFLLMIPFLFFQHVAMIALVTLGGYALFWLAFKSNIGPLQHINDRWDISYGVYLYGWPVATLILWFNPRMEPWILALTAIPIAMLCGAASWWGLERWTKDLGRRRSPRPVSSTVAVVPDQP